MTAAWPAAQRGESGFARSPSLPVAVLLAAAPTLAVAQFRAMALAVTIGFAAAILAHWRNHRALPWPRPTPVLALAAALVCWTAISALWSIEGAHGLGSALGLGALLALAAMASRALERDDPANLRRLAAVVAPGLAAGIALLAFDHASGNLFRLAVRGFPEWNDRIAFGLKPAVSVVVLLLPLVLAVPGLPRPARAAILLAGVLVALWLPAESAGIAVLAGVAAGLAGVFAGRLVSRLAAAGIGLLILAAPLLFGLLLARPPDLSPLPFSAAHRVLIWDFVTERIAERPILGWGVDASRSMPGARGGFDDAVLDRFGLTAPAERVAYGQNAARLPLHPHNAALHLWLETGLVGAALGAALAAAVMLAAGTPPLAAAALGVAISGAVTGQLSFGLWQAWWVATLLLAAVAVAALRRAVAGADLDAPGRTPL